MSGEDQACQEQTRIDSDQCRYRIRSKQLCRNRGYVLRAPEHESRETDDIQYSIRRERIDSLCDLSKTAQRHSHESQG